MGRRANYGFEKRQREIKKQKKKEAKAEKKRLMKEAAAAAAAGETLLDDEGNVVAEYVDGVDGDEHADAPAAEGPQAAATDEEPTPI